VRRHDLRRASVGDEGGFTLVEALVAGLVLIVGLLAMIGVFDDTRDQNATGERHEIAVMQAEQALEEMRGMPYENLMLDAGAVQPADAGRLGGTGGGETFRVRPTLDERVVYYPTGQQTNAWVSPTSTVTVGPEDAQVDLTIYRYVTWRDEECRVLDLDALGANLPGAVSSLQGPLTGLLNAVTGLLFTLLNNANDALVNALDDRLAAINSRLTQLPDALAGITELDLCDVDLSLLQDAQQLGRLTNALPGLTSRVNTLRSTLSNILTQVLCILGCQNTVTSQINAVNSQLNCMFGTTGNDTSYLDGLLDGLGDLAGDLSDTDENTKRLSVAVVVDPKDGVGPAEPVWASTVARDPDAGVLTSGGASC
jgi:hypothetical protein